MFSSFSITRTTTAFVCAVVVFLFASVVFAQETSTSSTEAYSTEFLDNTADGSIPGDFVVGPGKAELVIDPGQSKTVELMVTNRTGQTQMFNFEVEDAAGSQNPDIPVVLLGEDRGPYTLKDYISYPQQGLELDHNERARIPVTVSIPVDAEAGGRYGSLLVTTVTKKAQTEEEAGASAASAVISRVGTLFFVTVPGDIESSGELSGFSTIPDQQFFSEGPVHFQVLYENKGDIHLNPYGEIRITNIFSEEVGFIKLDPWFAMPKSLRMREVSWDRALLIGRYTATLHLNRGYDDLIDTQEITFWVLPWKVILPVFAGLFLLFFAVRFIGKNFEFKRKDT